MKFPKYIEPFDLLLYPEESFVGPYHEPREYIFYFQCCTSLILSPYSQVNQISQQKVLMHFLRPSRILYDFILLNSVSFTSPFLKDLMESKSCEYHTKI
jgi:hypothetical protein